MSFVLGSNLTSSTFNEILPFPTLATTPLNPHHDHPIHPIMHLSSTPNTFPQPSLTIQPKAYKFTSSCFSSLDPHDWIQKCEQFLTYHAIPIKQRIYIASFPMDGEAMKWLTYYNVDKPFIDWKDFCYQLSEWFDAQIQEDHHTRFMWVTSTSKTSKI